MMDQETFLHELRQLHAEGGQITGPRANRLAEAIMVGNLHLGEIREALLHNGETDVVQTLNALVDLIEPYLNEDVAED